MVEMCNVKFVFDRFGNIVVNVKNIISWSKNVCKSLLVQDL